MKKLILLIIPIVVMASYNHAQEMVFTFIPKDMSVVDSIIAINVATGGSKTVKNTNVIDLTEITTDARTLDWDDKEMLVYPNPFQNNTELQLEWNKNEAIELYLMNSLGQILVKSNQYITPGFHRFKISTNSTGLFFIVVSGKNRQFSKKIMATGKGTQPDKIEYSGFNPKQLQEKSAIVENEDLIQFSIYSGDRITKISDTPKESKTYDVEFIECKDSDGKNYPIVKIGEQWWMAENMAYIPKIDTFSEIDNEGEKYYIFGYEGNDLEEAKASEDYHKYGVLYNWEAALKTCPAGWYLPNKDEWQQLAEFISNDNGGYEKVVDNWQNVGKHLLVGASDDYGFSAMGGGKFNEDGSISIEENNFWTSSQISSDKPIYFSPDEYYLYQNKSNPFNGFSVRCVNRNSTSANISTPLVNTNQTIFMYATSAKGGGIVYDDGGEEIISRGMCWNTTGTPTILDNKTTDSTGIGSFSSNLLNLETNTQYFSRAYATNSKGTSYGQEISFTTQTTESKLATIMNVTNDAAKIFQETFAATNDTLHALFDMGVFLSENQDVEAAFYITSELIEIDFVNGLSSSINIIEVDENGFHLTRGGDGTGNLKQFSSSKKVQEIKNNKVLVLNPYMGEFPYPGGNYDSYLPYFKGGDEKLEVIVKNKREVSLNDINSMGDYGFVIINTHGKPNSFSFYDLVKRPVQSNEVTNSEKIKDLLAQVENIPTNKFENGELNLGRNILMRENTSEMEISTSIEITDDYIRNSNLNLKDIIVFGNHCYSGFTHPFMARDNMVEAWNSRGVGTYYGYAFDNLISTTVDDDFCREAEAILIKRLAQDNDTTGAAHLSFANLLQYDEKIVRPNILGLDVSIYKEYQKFRRAVNRAGAKVGEVTKLPLYFSKFFSGNYKYGCIESFIDERDGREYKAVCIGDQIWMAENLNYVGSGGICYDYEEMLCDSFGRLYSIKELTNFQLSTPTSIVRGLCPSGWHVPSVDEYMKLFNTVGGIAVAGPKLMVKQEWEQPNNFNDEYGFRLEPSGAYYTNPTIEFALGGFGASFWTSSIGPNSDQYYSIDVDENGVISTVPNFVDLGQGSYTGSTCRCVKDKDEE